MKRTGNNRAMVASKTRIPEGWRLVRLGDVAEINPRRPPLSVPAETPVTFLPMAAIAESSQGIVARESRPYSEVSTGYTYFEENDFLFSKITPCLQNGKHTLATGLRGGFGFGTTEFHVVRTSSILTAPFMFRALTQAHIIDRCSKSFTGTAGQQRVQPETLKDLPILLPPLPEQRAIAAVLDSIDDAIERTDAVIAATEQLRGSLLHQLLTRGVPGWHTEWKEAPGLGTMPADWEVVSLGEVIGSTTYGTNIQLGRDGAVAVLRMNNLQGGELDLRDVRRADLSEKESNDLSLVPGDILFNRTNSRDLVGKVAIVRDLEQPVSFASYLIRLRAAKTRANPYWLVALLGSSQCQDRIRKFATPGVSQANINPTNLKSLTISLPSLAEQQTVARVLYGADATLVRVRQERAWLQRVKDSTSDVLLTGQVRAMA